MAQMEIERKFIIRKPAILSHLRRVDMVQTYLLSLEGTRRVRMIKNANEKQYYFTHKIRHSDRSCWEDERQIGEKEYFELLKEADPRCRPIEKTRFYYPYAEHLFEIDVYPFWERQCVMEVELTSEQQTVTFPSEIEIVKEVTADRAYKNAALAVRVPEEMI